MPKYEVFVPSSKKDRSITLMIDAENWMAALKSGLQNLGEHKTNSGVMVDIMGDNSIHITDTSSGRVFRIRTIDENVTQLPTPLSPSAATSISQSIDSPIGRKPVEQNIEEILCELFERTQEVFDMSKMPGMGFLLDLALEKIPADSGSIFVSDSAKNDLELIVARGPKSHELDKLKLRLPVGVGIVGFCVQEAVCLAISNTEKDPRFYREVSKKLGYATKSILCAPMVFDGQVFGCIEVINKKDSPHFADSELAILSYIAHQGAKYLNS
jgi:hypothetical protein